MIGTGTIVTINIVFVSLQLNKEVNLLLTDHISRRYTPLLGENHILGKVDSSHRRDAKIGGPCVGLLDPRQILWYLVFK